MTTGSAGRGLTANQLKLIAIAAMTVDHLTWALFPGCQRVWYVLALHIIGRLTAPIMWFFIAEGSHYTRDPRRYILRLFGFAVVSHFAYDFAFGIPFLPLSSGFFNQTSVLWALALAAVLIAVERQERIPSWVKYVCIFAACLLAFPADWSSIAVMAPFFLYLHRGDFRRQAWDIVLWTAVYALVYVVRLDPVYGVLQMFTVLSIPLLRLYKGERGTCRGMKWLFYIYYPAHLAVIGVVRLALHGDVSIIF
ncbi:MAG: conjugal transfer protein TraX [Clostridia bacterium]|nr:conjugal transfer protein TraX [Clostridia bacterium]